MGLSLAERRAVTETTAVRYRLASKGEKGRILDELCAIPGGVAIMPAKHSTPRCGPRPRPRAVRGR